MLEIQPRPTYKPRKFCIDPGRTNMFNDQGDIKWRITMCWNDQKVTEVYRVITVAKATQMKEHWKNTWDKGDYEGFNRDHWVWYEKWTNLTSAYGKHLKMQLIYRNDGSPEDSIEEEPSVKILLQMKLIELRQLEREIDALVDKL